MYKYGDFCESYYEHACSIAHEKDVLETDIKGVGCAAIFKRWWYNLFLLSYTDKRTKHYYNSSHAVRVARARHFRQHRSCIHPLSVFRNFWDGLMLHITFVIKSIFYHSSSITSGLFPLPVVIFGIALEALVILDIFVNSKTGYINTTTRKIVLNANKSFRKYCSTKILFHVASSIPLITIMFIKYGLNINCVACKSNHFVCACRILDVIKLFRVYELSSFWTKERYCYSLMSFLKVFRVFMLGVITMGQYVAICDTFNLLSFLKTGQLRLYTYFGTMIAYRFHLDSPPSNAKFLAYDLTRIVKHLLLYNYGFNLDSFYLDKISCLIVYLLSNLFYIWGMLEAFLCITRKMYPENQKTVIKTAAANMARCRQIPAKFSQKLNKFYDFNMVQCQNVEKRNGLFKSLPPILRREIKIYSYNKKVMRIPFFREWSEKLMGELLMMIKEEFYLMNDMVAESGVQGSGLFIVDVGVMSVYNSDNTEVGHLIDGDYFGELSLVTDKEIRSSYVVAVTNCKVLILEKRQFRIFMRDYPKQFYDLKQKLRLKYDNAAERDPPERSF